MIGILRVACIGWGLITLLLAFMCFSALSMLGFPDGYISPYELATRRLQEVLVWLVVAQGVYFLLTGLAGRKLRPWGLALQVVLVMAFILTPIGVVQTCPRWNICTQAYQAMTGNFMDDGTGG